MFRKVINVGESVLLIYLKYDSIEKAETEWRVILTEEKYDYEEQFIFKTAHILSSDEIE
jgi:hypothetical protein